MTDLPDTIDKELVAVPLADLTTLIANAFARWLSIEGAAHYSSLSSESIRRLIAAGDLTAYRPRRGRVLIDRRQLDAVILGSTSRPRTGRGRSDGTTTARKQRAINGRE